MENKAQRIFELGEVFTPDWLVREMCDCLPDSCFDPDTTFLEPSCGQGAFVLEILQRKLDRCLSTEWKGEDGFVGRVTRVIDSIYGIELSKTNADICRRACCNMLRAFCAKYEVPTTIITLLPKFHIYCDDMLKPQTRLPAYWDVIIGNPPYQTPDGGFNKSAQPLFPTFVYLGMEYKPDHLVMVIPARWYTDTQRQSNFRRYMMEVCSRNPWGSLQIKKLVDFPRSRDVFPEVEVTGGICYFHAVKDAPTAEFVSVRRGVRQSLDRLPIYDSKYLIRFPGATAILDKVKDGTNAYMRPLPVSYFDIPTYTNQSAGNTHCVCRTGIFGVKRYRDNLGVFNKWKVATSKAAAMGLGNGTRRNKVLGKLLILGPEVVCSNTYVVVGVYDTYEEAARTAHYLTAPLPRFLVGLLKNSQQVTGDKFTYVPAPGEEIKLSAEDNEYINGMIAPWNTGAEVYTKEGGKHELRWGCA